MVEKYCSSKPMDNTMSNGKLSVAISKIASNINALKFEMESVQPVDQAEEDFKKFISTNNFTAKTPTPLFRDEDFPDKPPFTKSFIKYIKQWEPLKKEIPICDPYNTKKYLFFNGDLVKTISKEGEHLTRPYRGDICKLDIIGRLVDGDEIVEKFKDLVIQQGDLEVIEGLDFTIQCMDIGEISYIKMAPRFAYGKYGEKHIPRNAAMKYKVVLKSVNDAPEIETLSLEELAEISKKKRLRGNWWFHRMQVNHAITCYQRALEFLYPSIDLNLSSDWKKVSREWEVLGDERLKVHYNLGIAYMKQGDYNQALENINIVLEHEPEHLKALYRKGILLKFNEEYEASYIILLEISRQTLNDIDGLEKEIDFVRNKFREQQKKKLVKVMDEDLEMWSNFNYERVNYISNKKDKVKDQNKFMQGFLCVLTEVTSAAVIIAIIHRYF